MLSSSMISSKSVAIKTGKRNAEHLDKVWEDRKSQTQILTVHDYSTDRLSWLDSKET